MLPLCSVQEMIPAQLTFCMLSFMRDTNNIFHSKPFLKISKLFFTLSRIKNTKQPNLYQELQCSSNRFLYLMHQSNISHSYSKPFSGQVIDHLRHDQCSGVFPVRRDKQHGVVEMSAYVLSQWANILQYALLPCCVKTLINEMCGTFWETICGAVWNSA